MFGFGKKKPKPAKKSTTRKATPKRATTRKATGAKKAAPVRKAAAPRKTRAMCVVCRERTQTNTTLRICGRRRCAAELRAHSQDNAPATKPAAPRRAPAERRSAATRARPAPATAPTTTGSSNPAGWLRDTLADAARSQIRDWSHHHRRWRDEIIRNAAALNRAAGLLSEPDRGALASIAAAAAAVSDYQIDSAAKADTLAKQPSSTAARLLALGDRLTALTTKYERAGVIRVTRS
ncbi:hypothetical protein AB0F52_01635 [Amycolatopsis sp. NPDC024027]|uniref:hypothetical protein n=1 Tax=Amycolatopsis sp. NPDC024027 TaxID=3154327 RepID=UPI0033D73529